MDHGIRTGTERSGDSTDCKGKGRRMKYYDKLDNYTDTRPSKLKEIAKRIMPTVIFLGAMSLMFFVVGALEVL